VCPCLLTELPRPAGARSLHQDAMRGRRSPVPHALMGLAGICLGSARAPADARSVPPRMPCPSYKPEGLMGCTRAGRFTQCG